MAYTRAAIAVPLQLTWTTYVTSVTSRPASIFSKHTTVQVWLVNQNTMSGGIEDGGITLFAPGLKKKARRANRDIQQPAKKTRQDSIFTSSVNDEAQLRGHGAVQQPEEVQHASRQGADIDTDKEAGPGPGSVSQQQIQQVASTFKALGLTDWLCSVCKSLGMPRPTQVQQGCIPAILAGKDVIGLAHTGSGKTAAFALPILQLLSKDPFGVYALVLTPTRELAIQIAEQFRALAAGMTFRDSVIIGGVDMQAQARELARRPHVVIATPGRLRGLLDADSSLAAGLARTKFLVLDEADRVLDITFEDDLRHILKILPPGDARQTLLFSATMTQALIKLQQSALDDAYVFQAYEGLKTASNLREQYLFIPAKVKEVYLAHVLALLPELKVRSAMIFCSTCKGCEVLSLVLEELGLACAALHSGKAQKQRLAALASFKSEAVRLLLATDVASRGLDIPTVDLVINYDLPILASDYVHRVGRTARAGRGGWALSFVTQHDVALVHAIEELIGHQLTEYSLEEKEVLKGITKVFAAKRTAMLRIAESEGVNTKDKKIKRIARQFDSKPSE